ncbi:MAG: sulfotransferase [Bacteroidetes bacterium]|nr:sulfotransferase [Bacteroidota bacterium]
MKHSYLLSVITFGKLFSMVVRNKGVSPAFFGRFLFLLQGSIWASIFKRVELLKFNRKKFPKHYDCGPVFIIGHWRTGSTFLHQLMSLDPQFVTPSVVQVSVPDSFLVSENYFRKIMSKVIGEKRPMDNVKLGPDEPQEDEYAIVKLVKGTALEKIFFRRNNNDFLADLKVSMENERLSENWEKSFSHFVSKLVYKNNGIALFKNPFHSYRVRHLKALFPNAKFIHIHRNPLEVIPSTIRMWNIVGSQNLLAGKWTDISYQSAIDMFNSLWGSIKLQTKDLDSESYCKVRFDELEADTVGVLKKLYSNLNLSFSDEFEKNVREFLLSVKTYEKNKYVLEQDKVDLIREGCNKFMNSYNYEV